jgi:hypothetical protein
VVEFNLTLWIFVEEIAMTTSTMTACAMTLTTVSVSTTHVECVMDLETFTSVGAQIFQKVIAIVMESNSMLMEFVVGVVRRI